MTTFGWVEGQGMKKGLVSFQELLRVGVSGAAVALTLSATHATAQTVIDVSSGSGADVTISGSTTASYQFKATGSSGTSTLTVESGATLTTSDTAGAAYVATDQNASGGTLGAVVNNDGTIQTLGVAADIRFFGTSTGDAAMTINNTGTIASGTGSAILTNAYTTTYDATFTVNNSGTLTTGGTGIGIVDIDPQGSGSGTDSTVINNSGTIQASSDIAIRMRGANGTSPSVTINNTAGTIAGTGGYAAVQTTNSTVHYDTSINVSGGSITADGTGTAIDLSTAASDSSEVITLSGGSIAAASTSGTAIALRGADTSRITLTGGSLVGRITTATANKTDLIVNPGASASFSLESDVGTATDYLASIALSSGTLNLGANLYANRIDVSSGSTLAITDDDLVVATAAASSTTGGTSSNANANGGLYLNGGTLDIGTHRMIGSSGSLAGGLTVTDNSSLQLTIGATTHGYLDFSSGTTGLTVDSGKTLTVVATFMGYAVQSGDKFLLIDVDSSATNDIDGTIAVSATSTALRTWTVSTATTSMTDSQNYVIGVNDIYMTATENSAASLTGVSDNSAKAVDAAVSNGGPSTLASALNSLPTNSQVNNAGEQLHPSANGGSIQGATQATIQALRVVEARSAEIRSGTHGASGVSTGETSRGVGVWGQAFGYYGSQDSKDGIDGYTASTGGVALGADTMVLDNLLIGVSGAYGNTRVEDKGVNDGNLTKINSYQGTLYGTYYGDPWYLNGLAAFAFHKYDTTRKVDFSGFSDEADGSHDGQQYTIKIDGGYPLDVGGGYLLTPTLGAQWSHLDQDGYSESSSNGSALRVDSVSSDSVKSMVGVTLSTKIHTEEVDLLPEVRLGWNHEFNDDAVNTTASYVAGGSSFTTTSMTPGSDAAVFGLGLTLAKGEDFTLRASYDLELKDAYVGHNGLVQIRSEF